jgi:mono/diheme cytochrome c family protein
MKWFARIIVALVVVALAAVGWVYAASELHLRSFERPPPFAYPIATDAATIERGDHLVRTRGCRGCHGDDLGGEFMWGMASAPNLAAYARTENAATFEAALRHGIGRDGKALYSMPSYNFVRMRDEDVAAMFAYLQTQPVVERELPAGSLPWSIRLDMALGEDAAIPAYLDLVPPLRRAEDANPAIVRGEYIAMTTCNECHGFGLRADSPWEGESAPDLMIVLAYDLAAFQHLMRTGKALGDRELDMMSGVARGRFAHFTDQEVEDVYTFLRDMSARASATQ